MGPLSDLSAVEGAWHEVTCTRPQALYYMYSRTLCDESRTIRRLHLSIRLRLIVKAAGR